MYVTHDQTILNLDKSKRHDDDSPVFSVMLRGEEVFTPDPNARGATRFGTMYFDTLGNPVIVPDETPTFGLTTFRNIID